jgi:hypothetical protein
MKTIITFPYNLSIKITLLNINGIFIAANISNFIVTEFILNANVLTITANRQLTSIEMTEAKTQFNALWPSILNG